MLLGVIVAALLSLYSLGSAVIPSVALEQQARCGRGEHLHSEQCYVNRKLVCEEKEHAHGRNCYLVLLEENDINHLLGLVAEDKDRSLEMLIRSMIGEAFAYDRGLVTLDVQVPVKPEELNASVVNWLATPWDQTIGISRLNTTVLNETVTENGIEPGIVFNEDLYSAVEIETGPGDTSLGGNIQLPLPQQLVTNAAGGSSTLAVGDPAVNTSGVANIYVYVDGAWQCIGNTNITVNSSGNWWNRTYTATISTADTVNMINTSLGTNMTWNGFAVRSAEIDTNTWRAGTVAANNITLRSGYGEESQARAAKNVRITDSGGNPIEFYSITFWYEDGSSGKYYARPGATIILPENHVWLDANGNEVDGGTNVTVSGTAVYHEKESDGSITVSYDINFPTVTDVAVTVGTEPTLQGTAVQTISDRIENGNSALVRNVSQQEVWAKVNGHGANMSRVIRFSGWRVGDTDTIISANSTLTWEELKAYAGGSRVRLTAVWEYRAEQTASFYIRYDSVAMDTQGNQISGAITDYTPELFATFVGGTDAQTMGYNQLNSKYYIADTSSDNSYGADQAIRARYGEQEGIWLQSFPRDEDVFEQLKQYAEYLKVDGKNVDVNDLNPNAYTIRWYVMKCQSDAWHIDGRLVRKEGIMHVTKTFAGNQEGIERAKQDFRIAAANDDNSKQHTLTLNNYAEYDAETDTYTWEITGVEYGEPWNITEYTYGTQTAMETTYDSYAAYSVVDIFNMANNKTGDDGDGDGILTVEVDGQTYATDAGEVQVLRVQFTNVYHSEDSIIIKKEDEKTGNPLGGATFQMLQGGEVMRFTYNSEKNQYFYSPGGPIDVLSGSVTGYYEIMTTGFSYDNGTITVRELQAPEGYTPIESIDVGEKADGSIGVLSDSPMAAYHNGLLIVKNTTENTSVTAKKEWLCPEAEWQDVTVQLLANGNLASALIPGVNATAQLNSAGGWTYTWENLPTHANGSEIVWSVRETMIGNENCKPDFTFANWLVFYGGAVKTTDADGKVTNYSFKIQNDTRRTLLHLTKLDIGGAYQLSGATFTLQHLIVKNGVYVDNPDFVTRTLTTGANGTLTFDNLLYGRYRLVETVQPYGYEPMEHAIYLEINENGTVTVDTHPFARAGSTAYSVVVYNRHPVPLPSTGGTGAKWYHVGGILMILAATCGYILPKTRRKGRYKPE